MGPMRWLQVASKRRPRAWCCYRACPAGHRANSKVFSWRLEDINADVRACAGPGVPWTGPHERFWGRDATFTDPEGNGFVLITPAPEGV
jgi:hypothetical protein